LKPPGRNWYMKIIKKINTSAALALDKSGHEIVYRFSTGTL
jgi:hypothetical protein